MLGKAADGARTCQPELSGQPPAGGVTVGTPLLLRNRLKPAAKRLTSEGVIVDVRESRPMLPGVIWRWLQVEPLRGWAGKGRDCRSYFGPVSIALVVIARNLIPRVDLVIDLHTDRVQGEEGAAGT